MTYSEAKKLKTGDRVVIKAINKSVEVAEIKEKPDCANLHKYIEIRGKNGGRWTHKQVIHIVYYAIAYSDSDCKGFSETEPYILVDFEDYRQARKQANSMISNGYNRVCIFSFDSELPENVTWDYVEEHLVQEVKND